MMRLPPNFRLGALGNIFPRCVAKCHYGDYLQIGHTNVKAVECNYIVERRSTSRATCPRTCLCREARHTPYHRSAGTLIWKMNTWETDVNHKGVHVALQSLKLDDVQRTTMVCMLHAGKVNPHSKANDCLGKHWALP